MKIYSNRFFNSLFISEVKGLEKKFEKQGVSITDEEKFKKYASDNAKFNFWFFIMVGVFVVCSIARYLIRIF